MIHRTVSLFFILGPLRFVSLYCSSTNSNSDTYDQKTPVTNTCFLLSYWPSSTLKTRPPRRRPASFLSLRRTTTTAIRSKDFRAHEHKFRPISANACCISMADMGKKLPWCLPICADARSSEASYQQPSHTQIGAVVEEATEKNASIWIRKSKVEHPSPIWGSKQQVTRRDREGGMEWKVRKVGGFSQGKRSLYGEGRWGQ